MGLSAQKFREIVFQLLYTLNFEESNLEGLIPILMQEHAIAKSAAFASIERALQIWEKKEEINQKIVAYSPHYKLERIAPTERSALALGIFELFYSEIPPKVALAEAMRLCRKFATKEAASFVNALLDALYKEKIGVSV